MSHSFFSKLGSLVLVATAFLPSFTIAAEDAQVGVPIKIWAKVKVYPEASEQGYIQLESNGVWLGPTPGAAGSSAPGSMGQSYDWGAQLVTDMLQRRVEPGKSYQLALVGDYLAEGEINIVAPPGYVAVLDGTPKARQTTDGPSIVTLELRPQRAKHPGLAGMVNAVESNEVDWQLSMGALRNGGSAGELSLVDIGPTDSADWASLFTPGRLYYEPLSDEVAVYRPNNIISEIVANQVVVSIVTLSSSSYEIRCYNPTQMQSGGFPHTFTGQPYATYRIEQGATATSVKFTREIRNVVDATSNPSVARREIMSLTRSGTWPSVTWTRSPWTLEGQVALSETIVQSGGSTNSRTETISVRPPGTSTPALSVSRSYTVPADNAGLPTLGEMLTGETVGSSNGASSSFSYYTAASDAERYGLLKSATMPGQNWVAYDYYPTNVEAGYRSGKIKYRYRPYLNSPSTVTMSTGSGEITYYEYSNDIFGVPSRPSLIQTSINGVMVSQMTTTYNDSYATVNGLNVAESVRNEYSTSSNLYQTKLHYYRDDVSNKFLRGQTHSITHPDGTRQSFMYQLGSWNGTTFTSGGGLGYGTASRVTVISGRGNSLGSAAYSYGSEDGYSIDTVWLSDGKSIKEVTIRDGRALVVRTESYVWKSSAWQRISYTDYTYDFAGRLTNRTSSTGATYSATYDGGLKTSETDEAGVTTTFTYDVHGRVAFATRVGSGAIGAVVTKMTYDAAGRVIREDAGYGQSGVVITQYAFDDAGRRTSTTPPGNYGVETYSYDLSARSQTTTRADGSTIITTDYLDGRTSSTTGTGTVAEYHTFGVESDGRRWHQVNVGTSSSPRWEKSWKDWLGRPTKEEHPGFTGQQSVVTQSFYQNGTGYLVQTTKTGFAPTLYEYNELGQVSRSGLDYDNNGLLELASSDRITDTETYVESFTTNGSSGWWMRTNTKTYPMIGASYMVIASSSRTRLTGHPANRLSETYATDVEGNITTQVVDVNRSARTSVATTTRTGISGSMVENTLNGFSVSVTGFDGLTVTKGYDSLLRPSTVTDTRGNTTTTTYVPGTSMVYTVTNAAGNSATSFYDAMGRVNVQRDPKNYDTRYAFNLRGQVLRQWGEGATPVEYGYDATYGARTSMSTFRGGSGWEGTTWPTSAGTADVTTWTYDGPSGLLTAKTDAPTAQHPNGCTVTQTYNLRGQTATRTLARNVTTTYAYDGATGELLSQTYSDSTPPVSCTYSRIGQVETVTDYTGTRDLVYDSSKPWRFVAEVESGFYGGRTVTRLYDESGVIGRVRGFKVGAANGDGTDLEQTFGFTTAGRFDTITSKRLNDSATSRTFQYGYHPTAALLQSVSVVGNAFITSRTYETQRDVITSLESKWSATVKTAYAYTYDERGQRSKVVQSGDAFGDYGNVTSRQFAYNGRGELTADIGYMGSDITDSSKQLPGRRFEYGYDSIGNRLWSNRTGVTGLRDYYTTNALNQYVSRENNTLPVSGTAEPDTGGAGGVAVSVQGGSGTPIAAGRQGRYWNDELAVANVLNPWRGPLTIFTAKRGTNGSPDVYRVDTRMAEIAARTQQFTYDNDGNMLSDGVVDYTWDAENRLIRMETTQLAQTYGGFPHRLLEFRYDYMGRRVQKRVVDVTANQEISCHRYLYDGWNVIAEYAAPGATVCGALLRSYTWGLDIALTMTNAGGVGALLQIADHPTGKTYFPTYDGNGNIVSLVNGSSGSLAAVYEYSPYGEPLRSQVLDSTVADNPFRFSTKWTDLETGLVYYGHRYYDPKNGRFINRDPIEETGGINLYGFCRNNPMNRWDVLGHDSPEGGPDSEPVGYDEFGNPIYAKKPEDEIGTSVKTNTPTPDVGNPVPDSDSHAGYQGDYGPDDSDPNAMDFYVDGMKVGQVGSVEASEYDVLARDIANAAGETDVNNPNSDGSSPTAAKDGQSAIATTPNETSTTADAVISTGTTTVAPTEEESLVVNAGRHETGVRTTTGDTKADEKYDGTRGRADEDDRLKKPTVKEPAPPPETAPDSVVGGYPDNGQPSQGIPKNAGALPPFTSPPKDLIPYGGTLPPPPGSNWPTWTGNGGVIDGAIQGLKNTPNGLLGATVLAAGAAIILIGGAVLVGGG